MAFDQRLPTVNGDDGQWGDILNQYLTKEHYDTGVNNAANGGHKTVTLQAGTSVAGTAPLKFTSGTLLATPEAGTIEYLSGKFYIRGTDSLSVAGSINNSRVTPRVNTTVSSATPAINTDTTDIFTITLLATAITSMTSGLTGTPTVGQRLIVRILDNGVARAITWGASFASRGVTLPTTTVISKYLYVGFVWNEVTTTWDCVAYSQE